MAANSLSLQQQVAHADDKPLDDGADSLVGKIAKLVLTTDTQQYYGFKRLPVEIKEMI
jgi:hypothetical protein